MGLGPTEDIEINQNPVAISNFWPNPVATYNWPNVYDQVPLQVDAENNLMTRGPITSDEGSFRDDFDFLEQTLTGTLTFTNGSSTVTGIGTLFFSELSGDTYIRRSADSSDKSLFVLKILSDTELELEDIYQGTSGSGTGVKCFWRIDKIATATVSQTGTVVLLETGTNSSASCEIHRFADYGPMQKKLYLSISNRRANQLTMFGFVDEDDTYNVKATFEWDGTDATKVRSVTCVNGSDLEQNTITIPGGLTTASYLWYEIQVSLNAVVFLINDIIVATHVLHIPGPYQELVSHCEISNTGTVAGSTIVSIDLISINNFDLTAINNQFKGQPINVVANEDQHNIVGQLTTTSNTSDQVLLSFIVPPNKSCFIVGYQLETDNQASNTCKIGRNTITSIPAAPGTIDSNIFRLFKIPAGGSVFQDYATPRFLGSAGDTIKLTVSPAANNSTTWRGMIDYVLR